MNIDYCNERIQTVYHQLFEEALKRYNEKQTRSDRHIPNYYEKIRSGNQEKPFHEIILQVGNQDDMSATGEYAELARTVLDEYYQSFQERNPNLRVFSAHLHMDEATPICTSTLCPLPPAASVDLIQECHSSRRWQRRASRAAPVVLPSGRSGYNPKKNSLPP